MKEKIRKLLNKRVMKVIIIVLIAFVLLNIGEIIVTSQTASRNKEWGLKLTASNVSTTGLSLTMERENSERYEELTTGDSYWLEKRTLFEWKPLELEEGKSLGFLAIGYPLDDGDSQIWNYVNWEDSYGELGPGIYRIAKDASFQRVSKYSMEELLFNPELKAEQEREREQDPDPIVYATFVVLF